MSEIVGDSKNLDLDQLPEGMKVFIEQRKVPKGKDFYAYLYKLKKEAGQNKLRRRYKEKMINQFYEGDYDQEYIKQKYGGGEYQVVYTWPGDDGGKNGVKMEPISIDGPEINEPLIDNSTANSAGPGPGNDPTHSKVSGTPKNEFDLEKILKWVPLITSAIEAMKGLFPKPDYSFIDKINESQIKSIEKF